MSALPRPDFERKLCPPQDLPARLPGLSHPLVFTNGCFDILHRGHVTYLAQARALGASMVVALNTDDSVKRLGKGDERPLNPLTDRAAVIADAPSGPSVATCTRSGRAAAHSRRNRPQAGQPMRSSP